jgi:hypothetical protein
MRDLHYEASQIARWMDGITARTMWGNETAAFQHLDRAQEIREEIEALRNGAPL